MTRLTNHDFIKTHHRLKRYWHHANTAWSRLLPAEQWHLHDFFAPTLILSDDELVQHRAEMSARSPQLPQQAGRALVKIDDAAAAWALAQVSPRPSHRAKGRLHVEIYAVVVPYPKWEELARIAVEVAGPDQLPPVPYGVVMDEINKISYRDPGE